MCRLSPWQVALAPDMSKVAVAQTALLTIHKYQSESNTVDEEAIERNLELPSQFRQYPQSRKLLWCPMSRFLLLFSRCKNESSSPVEDILILDTVKGELLGTLCTKSLLESCFQSSDSDCSCCVNIFCLDKDMYGDNDEITGYSLFCFCLVSASGALSAFSCLLNSIDNILTASNKDFVHVKERGKGLNQQRVESLTCYTLAVTENEGDNPSNHNKEVDDVLWLPSHATAFVAISSVKSHLPVSEKDISPELHIVGYSFNPTRQTKKNIKAWKWSRVQSPFVINLINPDGMRIQNRVISMLSNSEENMVLLVSNSDKLVLLQLDDVEEGSGVFIKNNLFIDHRAVTEAPLESIERNKCSEEANFIAEVHFLSNKELLVYSRNGSVVVGKLCVDSCRLLPCSANKLPPALGICSGHSVAKSSSDATDLCDGLLSRVSFLRAVDSWSCQV